MTIRFMILPLAGLPYLEEIEFSRNQITDISPLRYNRSLKVVKLNHNNIEDVSPLKGFTSFDTLILSGNPIKNIHVLSYIPNLVFTQE